MIFFILLLIASLILPTQVFAVDPPVAEQMRATELIRVGEEKDQWLDRGQIFFFDQIRFDDDLGSNIKEDLSKLVTPSQGQFLSLEEMKVLCAAVRAISHKHFPQARGVFCDIKDRILEVTINP